ncbi:hypothetical protein [Roseibium sp.]|uniref:hypothetical protein n=1 Tax=Roseibium sp. TaxID=1936156 RepID=UPI003D0C11B1
MIHTSVATMALFRIGGDMRRISGNIVKSVFKAAVLALGIGYSAVIAEGKAATHDMALAIVDKAILKQSGLTFKNTLKHILRGDRPVENVTDKNVEDFLQSLLDSFASNRSAGMPPSADFRPSLPLAVLQPKDLLDERSTGEGGSPYSVKLSAVFFRPDLAPKSFNDCGEFRIVYSFDKPVAEHPGGSETTEGIVERFFLIFETRPSFPYGAQMNDLPKERVVTCQMLARKWAAFRTSPSSPRTEAKKTEIATTLNNFFYHTMNEAEGRTFSRAMRAEYLAGNSGTPLGQVRGNFRTVEVSQDGSKEAVWQLREWLVQPGPAGKIRFQPAPTKDSPLIALYRNDRGPATFGGRFKAHLFGALAFNLRSPKIQSVSKDLIQCKDFRRDVSDRLSETYLVNALGAVEVDREFLGFQDISEPDPLSDLFKLSGGEFDASRKRANHFATSNGPSGHVMTGEHLLRRAQALSCAGCHQTTADQTIGESRTADGEPDYFSWPPPVDRFVHVREPNKNEGSDSSRLSTALVNHFLKFRTCVLDTLLTANPADLAQGARLSKMENELEDKIMFQRNVVAAAERSNLRFSDFENYFPEVLRLRQHLQSTPGAFVVYRRSH